VAQIRLRVDFFVLTVCASAIANSASDWVNSSEWMVPVPLILLTGATHCATGRFCCLSRLWLIITSAVPLDDAGRALAIPWDTGVHHIGRPWISNVNNFIPGLGFACTQAHSITALQVINATAER